jgi:hypothetical protein
LPVLVVEDGLDEAAGWEALKDLFPYSPPPHLRVLAAARLLAGDPEAQGWLARLGWEAPGRARRLSLAALDRAGVADVLARLGNPLRALAANDDLITRLCQLSDGDPLLVRLYVEALLPYQGQAAAFTPDDLATLEPGLDAYFTRWFDEQRSLSGADPRQDKRVRGLLNLCAVALGPLQRADALELAPDLFDDSWTLDEAARAVNRFLLGDGESIGYAFSHPRLDDYFADRLTAKERRAWQARFLDYGRRVLAALAAGDLPPAEASPYLIQFYALHLDPEPDEPPAAASLDLLSEPWLRAHEAVTGAPAGFLADARRAWRRAEADGPAGLGHQALAALCFTSLTAQAASIPAQILMPCVEAGLVPPALGLVLARQKSDLAERASLLAQLSPRLPAAERPALLAEALAAAAQVGNYDQGDALQVIVAHLPPELATQAALAALNWPYVVHRAEILAAIAARLPPAQAQPLWQNALALARAETEGARVYALLSLIPHLPPALNAGLAHEALAAAHALTDPSDRAHFLASVAGHLPEPEQPAVLSAAFEAAGAISWDDDRSNTLMRLAERLPPPVREQVYASLAEEFSRAAGHPRRHLKGGPQSEEREAQSHWATLLERYAPFLPEADVRAALQHAWTIDEVSIRIHALSAVALRLPPAERRDLVAQALASLLNEAEEYNRLQSLVYLLDKTPDELLPDAVAAVRAVPVRDQRALMLARLAARMPPAQRKPVLAEALAAARALNDETFQAAALAALAAQLPSPRREALLLRLWQIIKSIPIEGLRLGECRRLAAQPLPPSLLDEMLAQAASARGEVDRSDLLAYLAPQLSPAQVSTALAIARGIVYASSRCRALIALARQLPEAEAPAVFAEAAVAARESEYSRPEDLLRLAQAAPLPLRAAALAEAIDAIRQSPHAHHRANWLAEASDLTEDDAERRSLLAGAFTAGAGIRDEFLRAEAVAALAPRLPSDVLPAAVQVAAALDSPYDAAKALVGLAPRLVEDDAARQAALAAARALKYPIAAAPVFAALAAALPEGQRAGLVSEALALLDIVDPENRAQELASLASHLPQPERLAVLELAVQAAEAHQPGVIHAAHGAWLAALPPTQRVSRGRALLALVPGQPETNTQSATVRQAQALRHLYDGLPDELLAGALRLAWPVAHHGDADAVIRLTAERWGVVRQASNLDPFTALTGTLRAYLHAPRSTLLAALAALAPAVAQAGGPDTVESVARALLDASQWWA